jgi:hypothetical protein
LRRWDKSSGARRRHGDAIWTAHSRSGDLFEGLSSAFPRSSALPVPRRLWPDRERGRAWAGGHFDAGPQDDLKARAS